MAWLENTHHKGLYGLFCFDSAALLMLLITSFICLVESKPVKQEVSHTVILPCTKCLTEWSFGQMVLNDSCYRLPTGRPQTLGASHRTVPPVSWATTHSSSGVLLPRSDVATPCTSTPNSRTRNTDK